MLRAKRHGRDSGIVIMPSDDETSPVFTPMVTAEAALRMILDEICRDIDMYLAQFMESDEESGAHKTRVALRRLTTALDSFAPLLRRKARKVARDEAKTIFRQLGHVRDADVFIAGLAERARTPALLKETDSLRRKTRSKIRRKKAIGFAARLMRSLGTGELLGRRRAARAAQAMPVGQFAAQALAAAWQTCQTHGADLAHLSEDSRHEFRKDMKSFRYLAEFFAPLWPAGDWEQFRERLQDLQDDLGTLNDLANARRRSGETGVGTQELRTLLRADTAWAELSAQPMWWQAN
jgi:CHAD domain-containing protein